MKRLSRLLVAPIAVLIPLAAHAQNAPRPSYVPPDGFVPDSITAVRIAVAVWTPIVGARAIEAERPYVAMLKDNVWFVRSSLPKPSHKGSGVSGGVAEAEIAKSDGRILRVSFGR
jgi:hypothetical protein